MIDTDRKLRLEHMSAKEMVDANIAVSKDMFSLIYKNPCIRDLPKIASLYGLYGTFIIGHTDLFFAFGLSHETVHQEKIVEGAGWVFPEKILKKTGFWPGGPFYCRDFNAFKLHGANTDIRSIIQNLIAFEMFVYESRHLNLDIPEYFFLSEDIEHKIIELILVKDNKMLGETAKAKAAAEEKLLLQDLAIPEWPITPKSKKPGYLAYIEFAPCTACTQSYWKERHNYNHQENWDRTIKKTIHDQIGELFVVDKETAEYVFSELDKRNVYYYVMKERDAEVMARYKSKKALGDFIKTISDGEIEMDITEDIKFSVHFRNSGLVNYLIREYSVSQYPKDEVEYGNYLYFSSTEERRNKEGSDCIGGCYLFYLPSTYEEYFRREIKKREIQVGTPAGASWTHMNISAGRWYVVDLPDMPATELLIHEMTENLMETHFVSLFDDAATEYRMFDPTGLSIMSHRQSIYGMSTGKRDWTTVGTMVIPILDYIKKGFVVNNDPKPKTRADIENFNKGTHLPYYKPEVTTSPTAPIRKITPERWAELMYGGDCKTLDYGQKVPNGVLPTPKGRMLTPQEEMDELERLENLNKPRPNPNVIHCTGGRTEVYDKKTKKWVVDQVNPRNQKQNASNKSVSKGNSKS